VIGPKYLEVIWQGSDDVRTLLLEYDYLKFDPDKFILVYMCLCICVRVYVLSDLFYLDNICNNLKF
jgi:hypothetical protein